MTLINKKVSYFKVLQYVIKILNKGMDPRFSECEAYEIHRKGNLKY
jgi:hypothetical protein